MKVVIARKPCIKADKDDGDRTRFFHITSNERCEHVIIKKDKLAFNNFSDGEENRP